jgi:ABC-type nitrate/sulfonate/bicarbonate transport system ATPase subunit
MTGMAESPAAEAAGAPSAASDPIISLTSVGFRYPNGLEAIGDISLEVGRGEILAIVGPSGCGKSTLLRLLAGLAQPTRGKISRADSSEKDRHPTTMVFQEDTVVPSLRVADNVGLSYRFRTPFGWKRDRAAVEHVNRLLEMVGLQDFADYYPSKLSGGMKRRVAVLTAVAPLPSLLLMDEPFSALDEPTRILVHGDIYRLVREFGISTVLVTHDLGEAISLCDRLVLLSRVPARAVAHFSTPFGRERDLLDIRRTPEFLDFYGRVWGELELQIRAGRQQ